MSEGPSKERPCRIIRLKSIKNSAEQIADNQKMNITFQYNWALSGPTVSVLAC